MDDLTRFSGNDGDFARLQARQNALRNRKKGGLPLATQIPKHKRGDKFVRGPVPLDWLSAALSLGDKSGHLAWALWFSVGIQGKNPVRLTRSLREQFRISERTATRLLDRFAKAELVHVERQRGRGPDVTLLTAPPQD